MTYYCKTFHIIDLIKSLPKSQIRIMDPEHIIISGALGLMKTDKSFIVAACADAAGGLMDEMIVPISCDVCLPYDLWLRL